MTPQLQQAIKLLQLSNMELAAYVEAELERNPLLERAESPDDGQGDLPAGAQSDLAEEGDDPRFEAEKKRQDFEGEDQRISPPETPLDTDFENVFTNDDTMLQGPADQSTPYGSFEKYRAGGLPHGAPGEPLDFEQRLSETVTLRQHLLDQLQVEMRDPVDWLIGIHLIDKLDGSGYLSGDLYELPSLLGCSRERLDATLMKMQQFDPPGIFARSLKECLALQLKDRDRLDPAMEALLDNLECLASGNLAALRSRCGVDDEDLREMIAEIKALDPKPAERFDLQPAQPIEPDLFMRPLPAGGWAVELNEDTLPRVLVNSPYYASLCGQARSKAERDFVNERLQSANWLLKALHQRASTILKVAGEIVRQQDAFFRRGVEHMKPLTLRDVADAIEMHESTVSRVTTNKYMMTPRGTYELKFFFTAAIGGAEGSVHAAEAVRHRIKTLISRETPEAVLSDDHIVKILRQEGVEIARRTVAKYREAMRIPSSVQRRRQKAMRM